MANVLDAAGNDIAVISLIEARCPCEDFTDLGWARRVHAGADDSSRWARDARPHDIYSRLTD
jgi:hypothetical protein